MPSKNLQQAEAAHQRGNLDDAQRYYLLALDEKGVDRASALFGLGTIALQRGKPEDAAEVLGQAVAIAPDAADINFNYALCLYKCGLLEKAGVVALHTADLCLGDAFFAQAVGGLLLDLNLPAAAIKLLAGSPGGDAGNSILLARAMGALGDWDKSVSILRQLADQNRSSAKIALELSQAAGKLRDYPLAISNYRRYMGLSRATAQDYLRFADLYLMARDIAHSIEQLDLAECAGADSAEYHVLRARLARLSGDDPKACSASEEALVKQPGLGQAWLVRVETAGEEELAGLITRMNASAGTTDYQQTLIYYALADANRLLGKFGASADAMRAANGLQKTGLSRGGRAYDAGEEEQKHKMALAEFGANMVVAEPLADLPSPIFVVGMPRSGTTLMEKILAQLAGVTALGENEALGFVTAQFQRDARARQLPGPANMSAVQWQHLAKRYHQLSPGSGDYIVDKMPSNYLYVGMILSMFPDAKVIQMRRDPRDACLSIYSKPFPDGHNYACDPDALAHAFAEANSMMDYWHALDPQRVINVQFEDLVREPVPQSQRVSQFCGLPWSEGCLNFHNQQSASFTFSERQVRQAISDKPVGQWRAFACELPELFAALEHYGA